MTPLAEQEAQAEEIRRQARAVFVAEIRDWLATVGCGDVLADLEAAYRARRNSTYYGPGRFAYHAMLFAAGYGWPDTLRAVAQAMESDEQAQRELMDRR